MKESIHKTSIRSQADKNRPEGKTTSRTTGTGSRKSSRAETLHSDGSQPECGTTGRRSPRGNNPEGHNQYTKK